MSTFDELLHVASDHGLVVDTKDLDDGRIIVTINLDRHDSPVCGLACAVGGAADLDDAGGALLPALLSLQAERPDLGGDVLVACRCQSCDAVILYAAGDRTTHQIDTRCPSCADKDRLTARLSLALSLSLMQANLDDIAGRAPVDTATELVPLLAELARLGSVLAPTTES